MPFTTDGHRALHYRLDGDPALPALVLLNSIGTDLSMWDDVIEELASHFHVVRCDARGHGGSSVPVDHCSMADLGGDVLRLLDRLSIKRAHLCGLSLGGMTALWLGQHAPGRVDRLIAAANGAWTANPDFWTGRMHTVQREGIEALADGVMNRFFSESFHATSPQVVARLRQRFVATPSAGYVACCAAIRDFDLRSGLSEIRAPVLALAGTLDVASVPDNSRFIAESIPGARYGELEAAHLLPVEAPRAFATTVCEFLGTGAQP